MNNLNNINNRKPQIIGLLEIQNFACKYEALFYELYLKTQEMVDANKYLSGRDKELYNHDNLETITLLKTVSDRCVTLADVLKKQYEHLTIESVQKSSEVILEKNPKVEFVEAFY